MTSTPGAFAAAGASTVLDWNDQVVALAPTNRYRTAEAAGTALVDDGSAPLVGVTAASNITHNQASMIPTYAAGKHKITTAGGQIDTGAIATNAVVGTTLTWIYRGTAADVIGNGEIFRAIDGRIGMDVNATHVRMNRYGSSLGLPAVMCARGLLLDDVPHLCTLVYLQNDQRFYIDGTLVGSSAQNAGLMATPTATVHRFARSGAGDHLRGRYQEIHRYGYPFSHAQAAALGASFLKIP